MEVVRTISATRAHVAGLRAAGQRIGFVPTMGFLHEGHLSLVTAARHAGTAVVVSLFVNPTQFGPHEDFQRYPRDETRDLAMLTAAGVALVFAPRVDEMYPAGARTTVHVAGLTDTLCGPHRPGHFDGVATVVTKLFNIVQPDAAWFGQKDAQQLAVIRRFVRDLDLPIEIIGAPTVREPDGLAMSSRNALLAPDERQRATALYRALNSARDRMEAGERSAAALMDVMRGMVASARPSGIDYISIVDAKSLQPVDEVRQAVLVALAVRFGGTRLIDNITWTPPAGTAD